MDNAVEQLMEKSGCHDVRLLWLLRLLVPLEGYKTILCDNGFRDDSIAIAAGLGDILYGTHETEKYNQKSALMQLRANWEVLETVKDCLLVPNAKLRNAIAALASSLGLSRMEEEVLHLCTIIRQDEVLDSAANMLGTLSANGVARLLRICLDKDGDQINAALKPDSKLSISGLLRVDFRANYSFTQKVDLLEGLSDALEFVESDVISMFHDIFVKAPQGKLTLDDYSHLARDAKTIGDYLKQSKHGRRSGINFLLHGDPGTGKTEFVRMLADSLGFNLYEVATENRYGKPHDGPQRFRSYRLGQMLCSSSNQTAILFDEAEDVFCEGKEEPNGMTKPKAWVNRMLEENPVPAFWITNDVNAIDPAFVRRFDIVIEMNTPPRSVRERILNRYLDGLAVSTHWKKRISEYEHLPPAVVERAAKVARTAQTDSEKPETIIENILGNTIEAMGYPPLPSTKCISDQEFRLDVLNADMDLETLCQGLAKTRSGRLCLYGPPGTGKTAFGKYIAEHMDMPLMSRKASDILSPYIGQAEINMARMFREASLEGAVLLLDEADSFLQDRRGAERNWEISGVNEMLTQMESFEGIFVASTNFMSALDTAALRRFDVKLKFDYLRPAHACALFRDLLQRYGLANLGTAESQVKQLRVLTPGDFAAVGRKLRLAPPRHADQIAEMLASECQIKPDAQKRPIGF